jgi:hypothetical protein
MLGPVGIAREAREQRVLEGRARPAWLREPGRHDGRREAAAQSLDQRRGGPLLAVVARGEPRERDGLRRRAE